MKGKSTELATYLVSKLEHALSRKAIVLCAFMYIKGAFDITGWFFRKSLYTQTSISNTIKWVSEHNLSENNSITVLVPFHRRTNLLLPLYEMRTLSELWRDHIAWYQSSRLLWAPHLQSAINKASKTMWALKSLVSNTWGLNPLPIYGPNMQLSRGHDKYASEFLNNPDQSSRNQQMRRATS